MTPTFTDPDLLVDDDGPTGAPLVFALSVPLGTTTGVIVGTVLGAPVYGALAGWVAGTALGLGLLLLSSRNESEMS